MPANVGHPIRVAMILQQDLFALIIFCLQCQLRQTAFLGFIH